MPIGDFPESLSQAILVECNVSREIGRTPFNLTLGGSELPGAGPARFQMELSRALFEEFARLARV